MYSTVHTPLAYYPACTGFLYSCITWQCRGTPGFIRFHPDRRAHKHPSGVASFSFRQIVDVKGTLLQLLWMSRLTELVQQACENVLKLVGT